MIDIAQQAVLLDRALIVSAESETIEKIERVYPSVDYVCQDNLLAGLIRFAKEEFQLVFIRIPIRNNDISSALTGYRKVRNDAKIILLVDVFDEPIALDMLNRRLADDYLILPLSSGELQMSLAKLFQTKLTSFNRRTVTDNYIPSEKIDVFQAQYTGDFLRESAELVHSAELGLPTLLSRICWSAIFLLDAQSARITIEDESAQAGKETEIYNVSFPLSEAGREFGQLELLTSTPDLSDRKAVDFLEQIVPGLVRLARSQVKLKELANTDELTGLANRRFMQEVLERLFERAKSERFRITLVIFDFDDFKHYNDTYGHGAGDEILRESAMLIKRCIRRKDLAVRYGGDEFAVVLWDWQQRRRSDSEHPRSVLAIMQRFRKLLRQHYFPRLGPDALGRLTISGGLASYPWDANSIDELIERADAALLEAKRSGKDRIYLVGQACENPKDY